MNDHSPPPPFWPTTLLSWFDILTKLGAVAGAVFIVFEYNARQQDARVQRTMDYVQRFESGPVGEAQRVITRSLRDTESIMPDLYSADFSETSSQAAHRDVIEFLVYDSRNGVGIGAEVDTVVLFLDQLGVCVERNLCDKATAQGFFGEYADSVLRNFSPFIVDRRKLAPTYGEHAERAIAEGTVARPAGAQPAATPNPG